MDLVAIDEGVFQQGGYGVDVVFGHFANIFEEEGEGFEDTLRVKDVLVIEGMMSDDETFSGEVIGQERLTFCTLSSGTRYSFIRAGRTVKGAHV